MPLYSEHISNMYYSGSPYSSPYSSYSSVPHGSSYSASYLNPGGTYSTHSSLGGYTRPSPVRSSPTSSRWVTSSGRNYAPMLSTITERVTSSPVRISSPRSRINYTNRTYATPSYTPRPININTADIDVSKDKYRNKVEHAPPAPKPIEPETENGPFMPRIDGKPETGIDSSPGIQRSTIRRGRTVVRLHTVKRKDRESPRNAQSLEDSASEQTSENVAGDSEQNEISIGWREKLSEDLAYKDKKEKKTIGAKLIEKFIVKGKDSDSDGSYKEKKNKVEDVTEAQSTPISVLPAKSSAYSRSPDRRCSIEMLAEQAQVLDTLIRSENLSTAHLDLSQVGISEQGENQRQPSIKRRKSNPKNSPLQTTKSDYSLHQNQFKDPKNFSKKRSLKKSSSGSSICRLDSITEFPKELPVIEEIRTPIKRDSAKQKPIPKLKAVITSSSVEVSPPLSPLKFKVEVTVDEKPVIPKTPVKEIIYSTIVEDDAVVKIEEAMVPIPENIPNIDKGPKKHIKKKTKSLIEDAGIPSPEPDDGNFWDKIGKRETVYLMKRKQIIDEALEKSRRAFNWFAEEEEPVTTNETESCKDDIFADSSNVQNKIETTELVQNTEENKEALITSTINESPCSKIESKHEIPHTLKGDAKPDVKLDDSSVAKDSQQPLELKKKASPTKTNIIKQLQTIIVDEVKEIKVPETEVLQTVISNKNETTNLNKSDNETPVVLIQNKATNVPTNQNSIDKKEIITEVSKLEIKGEPMIVNEVKEIKVPEIKVPQAVISNKNETTNLNKSDNETPVIPAQNKITNVPPIQSSIDKTEIIAENSKLELKCKPVKDDTQTTIPPKNNNLDLKVLAEPKITEPSPIDKKETSEICPSCGGKVDEEASNTEQSQLETDKANKVVEKSMINNVPEKITPEVSRPNKIEKKVTPPKKVEEPIVDKKPTEPRTPHPVKDKKSSPDKTNKVSSKKKASLPKIKENKKVTETSPKTSKSSDKVNKTTNASAQQEEVKTAKIDADKKSSEKGSDSKSEIENLAKSNKETEAPKVPEVPTVIESENIPNLNEVEIGSSKPEPVQDNKIENDNKVDSPSQPISLVNLEVPSTSQPEVLKPATPRKPVKEEAAIRPLIATPRPLQKKVPQIIHSSSSSESSSEEESSDEDADESDTSEGSTEFYECENHPDGRTSTGSNDSGFDSSAPTSPAGFLHIKKGGESAGTSGVASVHAEGDTKDLVEHELEQSTAYGLFRRTGRFTPPARSIPRFRKYTIEDFHFIKVLGKGSFGKVMLAELRDTEYYYAVKCLKKDVVLEDDDVECTLIERKVLALGTNHPYLCHLFATFQTDCHLFFVMDYLNGGDLMFHIQQSGRFPEDRARFYAAEIVSGLKFLHKRGIVYRDLKLDNILLDFDGHVRIADFGMCKLQIYLDKTADTFCGTPDYMAPEIIKGQKYNQTVDWWSFGVLLYEMLIGQSPFSGCDEDELFWSICNEMPSYPRFLSVESLTILTRLLDKDMKTRLGGTECMHGDVRDQDFFHPIHWDRLERRELEAPFRPRVRHPLDTQYFDRAFTGERPRLTAVEPQVLRSMDQAPFRGFSYTNPNATDR